LDIGIDLKNVLFLIYKKGVIIKYGKEVRGVKQEKLPFIAMFVEDFNPETISDCDETYVGTAGRVDEKD